MNDNLAYVTSDNKVIMRGDNTTQLAYGVNRNRYETKLQSAQCVETYLISKCPHKKSGSVQHGSIHTRSGNGTMGLRCDNFLSVH